MKGARAGGRAVDLGGPKLEIEDKAAVFKRVSLLIGGEACHLERPVPPGAGSGGRTSHPS